jgi:hypothetical protein
MPYKSDAQRRFMHARHPGIAAKWDEEIRAKRKRGKVAKFISPERRLRAQKKASAVTSLAGGTVGLGGLGLLLASKKAPKLAKLERHLPAVGAVGAGISGVGAYNFASIQNQESKKRGPKQNVYVVRNKKQIKNIKAGTEPVTKGFDMMDFGLSDVHQGDAELVSKAIGMSGVLGAAKKVTTPFKGSTFAPKKTTTVGMKGPVSTSTTKTSAVSNPFFKRSAGVQRTVTGAGGASTTTGHAAKFKMTKLGVGTAATGGLATVGAGAYGANQMGQRKRFGKALTYEEVSKLSFGGAAKYAGKHGATAKHGAKAVKVASGPRHAGGKAPSGGRHRAVKTNPNARQLNAWQQPTTAPLATANPPVPAPMAARPAPATAPTNPPTTGRSNKKALAGGAAVGGTAVAAVGGAYEAGRRSPFSKAAYNPEAKRMRRNERTATALAVGSGASATYGGILGHRALGTKGKDVPVPDGPKMKGGHTRYPGTGLRSDVAGQWGSPKLKINPGKKMKIPPSGIRGGARTATKAGALGLGAVGLAVASDRVGSYQHKKGRTYRPLHRITSS